MNIILKVTPGLEQFLSGLKGDIIGAKRAGMTNAVTAIEALAVKKAPVRTSHLANSATANVSADGSKGEIRFTAQYAGYVHEGTGIYGPRKKRIVPRSKKALFWPGAAHPVKSTAGMKGRPFLFDALKECDPAALYQEGMNNYLSQKGR